MAIFREYNSGGKDRTAEDRRRHRQLVEEAIKKNLHQIIAEESIIGQSKDKKIKIPIKGLKEYQFIYGKNKEGVGTGTGQEKRGDVIGREIMENAQGQRRAGSEPGEDIYETEITIDDLVNFIFEDLALPYLERRKFFDLQTISNFKRSGYRTKGIPPRLAKRRSVIEKIKRKQNFRREQNADETGEPERFPFREDDLRYHYLKVEKHPQSNAVVICIMDTSGSMDQSKKYLARSFYFLLYQFLMLKYALVEVVFISHTTVAKEVNEGEFFHRVESGGTFISSGYEKALDIIEERFNPAVWNIYTFHTSDGDNWREDNEKALVLAKKLCETCNLFGYGEIDPDAVPGESTISKVFLENLDYDNFTVVTITGKEDVLPALKKILTLDEE
ncbi:MAG: sporulation protein YhbH [Bacillota bacterium]